METLRFSFVFLLLYVPWWRCRGEKSPTGRVESISRLHGVHDWEKDTSRWPSWDWFKWSETVSRVCKVRWLFHQFGSHFEIPWQTAAFVHNQNGGLHHGGHFSCKVEISKFSMSAYLCDFHQRVNRKRTTSRVFFTCFSSVISAWNISKQNLAVFDKQRIVFRHEITVERWLFEQSFDFHGALLYRNVVLFRPKYFISAFSSFHIFQGNKPWFWSLFLLIKMQQASLSWLKQIVVSLFEAELIYVNQLSSRCFH